MILSNFHGGPVLRSKSNLLPQQLLGMLRKSSVLVFVGQGYCLCARHKHQFMSNVRASHSPKISDEWNDKHHSEGHIRSNALNDRPGTLFHGTQNPLFQTKSSGFVDAELRLILSSFPSLRTLRSPK